MNRPGSRHEFNDMNGQLERCCALAHSRLRLIDHERRHLFEEFPKNLLGLFRQRSFPKSTIHQTHPSVAGSLIDRKRRMPRAEARITLVRFAGFLQKLDWIVSFSSLIVCTQSVSRDWLAIEKDCLYRVIR
jgi:hypothetical protein